MSAQAANRILIALSVMVFFVTAAVVVVGLRSEDTRRIVEHSACQTDPSGKECQKAKRQSSRAATVRDTCIPFLKVGIKCPQGHAIRKGVAQQGSSPSQPSGPSVDGSTPNVPQVNPPKGTPNVPKPSPPSTPPVQGTPPSTPPVATPPAPPVVPQSSPLIDVSPLTQTVCHVTAALIKVCQ